MTRIKYALLAFWLAAAGWAGATDRPADQRGYNIGDAVADFRLKSTEGSLVSLSDFRSSKGLIVVFTANHCPFAKAYEDRLIALDRKYRPAGFPVLAINPNDPSVYEEDSFDNMKVRARAKSYPFAYLFDETQQVAQAFGATRTPHVFVLHRSGERFLVQYIGAIDDSSQDPSGVTKRYVEDAVNNLITGKPVMLNVTKSVGCAIHWKENN